jgi:hypothetical protein
LSPARNQDYHDILAALVAHHARFLVVGAHALGAHGLPRATVDIDIWIDRTPENAARVWRALADFGAPLEELQVREGDLTRPEIVAQFGMPPNRIDILTDITGVAFEEAWTNRLEIDVEGVRVGVLGRAELIRNKLSTGRDKDRVDVKGLEGKS